ncbi:MAG: DUF4892 domain-containing protein [Gammaproteobacteria bacterium]|nr:DUF4892 domain-containing protein [Gammaproteobacteria bacterium]MDP2139233.1 DUF4892 domain-containing protein [Gammaproteobacteria bacterium]MDP2348998.1 DUF4892 domain-containing protein [Gammaproteobacteria bacterium]
MNWRAFLILLLTLANLPAWAQSSADVAGSFDHERVARFPGSHIADYQNAGETNYRLALGRMQRVNGRVTAGREERVLGDLTRITYQIPAGYPGADVFAHFAEQLLAAGGAELFRCQGRGCGSSNFWANDIFANRILYGPETDQFYLATTLGNTDEGVTTYAAVYVITRGNRSVYAHLDVLEIREQAVELPITTAETLLLKLRQEGSAILPGFAFDAQDQLIEDSGIGLLIDTLRSDPLLRAYVVVHLRAPGDLNTLMQRSARRATGIVARLTDAGIEAGRVSAQGVGPLAPACRLSPCGERVELVLQ